MGSGPYNVREDGLSDGILGLNLKYILCWALLVWEWMFSSCLRFCVMIVSNKQRDSTVLTGESYGIKGESGKVECP